MSTETLIISEFVIFFGLLAAFCLWQLMSVNKDIRATAMRRAEARSSDD
jgi:hypothetical protein